MSEYWVSRKKYFCKYCDIYIADDAPSRQLHENGMRHKGNQERFIRGLYKTGEKRKKDEEDEKREMQRVERAAQAAFAQDVGAGLAKAGNAPIASSPTPSTSRNNTAKPSNPYTNYSTATSLGYQDPDAERLKAETERRRTQGVAGDWELIPQPLGTPSQPDASTPSSVGGEAHRKREAEEPPDAEDGRSWKLRKKTVGPGLGEIYDPGIMSIKLKANGEEPAEGGAVIPVITSSNAIGVPKWTKTQWQRAAEAVDEVKGEPVTELEAAVTNRTLRSESVSDPRPKIDGEGDKAGMSLPLKVEAVPLKLEETPPVPPAVERVASIFRKRKAPGSIGSRGKRQT